jgi:glycosyltransferase involved in cell wall biosynthesis
MRQPADSSAVGGLGLSVCIPVYNEEGSIAETIERCLATRPALKDAGISRFELVVVDDGSKDHSADQVRRFPEVRLIQHPVNRGYGAALKTGFASATHDLIGFLDADATYPPEQFPALCRAVLEKHADLVIGSRMAGAESSMPLVRRIGNRFFAVLLTLLGRTAVSDTASGMRVFKRATLDLLSPLPDGLNLTPVMSARAIHEGINVVEVPIPYEERVGRSKLSVTQDGLRFLKTIVWTVLAYNPVRVFGVAGLVALAIAAVIGAAVVLARLQGITVLGPAGVYAVFGAVVAAVTGVSVFALGATFNYIVSLFYRRPIRQGLFSKPFFRTPVERHFLPLGVAGFVAGLAVSIASLVLSLQGWPIERLWLYLSGSAMFMIVGVQLALWGIVMAVLAEVSEREGSRES